MNTDKTSLENEGQPPCLGAVMPRLSIQQIESIEMMQIGEMFPKKLKHIVINHPMTNVSGLVKINGEYFQWVSCR